MTDAPEKEPTIKLGEKEYRLRKLNITGLRKAWQHAAPILKAHNEARAAGLDLTSQEFTATMMQSIDSACHILAYSLQREDPNITPQFIADNCDTDQMDELAIAVFRIMKMSGMIRTVGEKKAVEVVQSLLTETSTAS